MNRCNFDGCDKKLGLIPFRCRCEKQFCGKHRYPEVHQCTIDHGALARSVLAKKLSVEKTVADKVVNI